MTLCLYRIISFPVKWLSGALLSGAKRLGIDADGSPPPSSEVNKAWKYTSTPPYVFMAKENRTLSAAKENLCEHDTFILQ
jgi:hypothetical protein